ncbi:MAG TPA: MFS transporter [Burkholderiales bacterium]|nr:MFS transporter [Burkholderiales bacterium]
MGLTQIVAWASSVYLPAILADPIARDLGLSSATVFGAFSVSLIVMGLFGPMVGRTIDRSGGRAVLALSNLILASGLILLSCAWNSAMLFGAWCVLGIGMATGLYDAAFAALVRLHATAARQPIVGITLVAGFASTVGWPLTAFIAAHLGWRASCVMWAVLHLVLALPINLRCLPSASREPPHSHSPEQLQPGHDREPLQHPKGFPRNQGRAFLLLALFAAATAFVTSAMSAHLPGLLLSAGTSAAAALTASALLGPAQVAARALEFMAASRFHLHPLLTARIATALHPIGGAVLWMFGGLPSAASSFAVLHGAGNGMITVAKGTLPLAIFGARGYGLRQGLLSVLARAMQAAAPFAFGVVIETFGAHVAIALSGGVSLVALAALLGLHVRVSES